MLKCVLIKYFLINVGEDSLSGKQDEGLTKHYVSIRKRFEEYGSVLSDLGRSVRDSGPIDEKNSQHQQQSDPKEQFTAMQNRH